MPLVPIWKELSSPSLTKIRRYLNLRPRRFSTTSGIAEDVSVKSWNVLLSADIGGRLITFADPPGSPYLGRPFLEDGTCLDRSCEEFVQEVLEILKVGDPNFYLSDLTIDFRSSSHLSLPSLRSSCEDSPDLELKDLPSHLEYAFLEGDDKLPVIIAKNLKDKDKTALIKGVLRDGEFTSTTRKLNDATRKDHFPLPFMDQMLERFLGKMSIIAFWTTFAYRRMPFGLCNAPGTFQRCMVAIFYDMIEKRMEVFMDDFSVFGDSFSSCLSHLDKMLQRCEETNLVLNWEKFDVIAKLPHPTTVKGIRSFLGHAGFYRRFIQDFSKIARPMTHLLEKETPFIFSKECIEAFETLNEGQRNPSTSIRYTMRARTMTEGHSNITQQRKKNYLAVVMLSQDCSRGFLLLQEFDVVIRDKKGAENLAADHLSRLENPHQSELEKKEITETFPLETLGMVTFRGDDNAPWFADFANYHAGNFGKKLLTFLKLATVDPLGDTTVPITPLKRSLIQDFIGPRSTRMPTTLSPDVTFVNVKAKFRNVMRCHKTLSKFAKSLTCGALILWDRSRLQEGTNIYSWPLIIYQNGLKQKRSPPMTPELFANFLNLSSPDSVPLVQS
ncbi:reverse transcriptase domain-containing protein [Tanacetum coccineum]|uniref:Reverse transcriptase domain-containing protein n=1 Tax=Tanacetum coccineum TaxID=301880 RepID=A0ABQ5ERU9_9ASTR